MQRARKLAVAAKRSRLLSAELQFYRNVYYKLQMEYAWMTDVQIDTSTTTTVVSL